MLFYLAPLGDTKNEIFRERTRYKDTTKTFANEVIKHDPNWGLNYHDKFMNTGIKVATLEWRVIKPVPETFDGLTVVTDSIRAIAFQPRLISRSKGLMNTYGYDNEGELLAAMTGSNLDKFNLL